MNNLNEIEDNSIINVSFNQDSSCFSIGTQIGFKIYQTFPFKEPYERKMFGGIGTVEMLYKSNFLALLGGGNAPKFNNNKVVIWDENQKKVISELKFITPVINIKLKKDLLFVICHIRIYIFNFNTYDIIDTIDTGDNIKGLIAVNNDPEFTVMAYPSIKNLSSITIKNLKQKKNFTFAVQEDNINFMSINYDGKLIATASEKGKFIRIHSTIDGTLLKEFKRGYEKVEYIYICFDNDNKFMAVSSNKGTIHIFSLKSIFKKLKEIENMKKEKDKNNDKNKNKEKIEKNEEKEGYEFEEVEDFVKVKVDNKTNNNIINESNKNIEEKENELPDNSKSFFGSEKDFARFRIKPQKNVCTFVRKNLLIVVSFDNKYYQAEIDMVKGGNCKLLVEKTI